MYGPCCINFDRPPYDFGETLNYADLTWQSNGGQYSLLIGRISGGVRWLKVTFRWMWLADVRPATLLDNCQLQIASELVARKLLCAEGWCDMRPGSLDFLQWFSVPVDCWSARVVNCRPSFPTPVAVPCNLQLELTFQHFRLPFRFKLHMCEP